MVLRADGLPGGTARTTSKSPGDYVLEGPGDPREVASAGGSPCWYPSAIQRTEGLWVKNATPSCTVCQRTDMVEIGM
jgi:hypothetical protein